MTTAARLFNYDNYNKRSHNKMLSNLHPPRQGTVSSLIVLKTNLHELYDWCCAEVVGGEVKLLD